MRTMRMLHLLVGIAISMFMYAPAISLAANVHPNCCNYAAGPNAIKIQFLLEACAVPGQTSRGKIPYFDCQSYVLGVIDAYRIQMGSAQFRGSQSCLGESISTRDVLESIWARYPNWNVPEGRGAADVILEVLPEVLHCGH